MSGRNRRTFGVLIGIQLALIAGLSLFIVFTQPFYARVDERADVSYIEYVATHGKLPILGRTCVQQNLVPLQPHYPGRAPHQSCAHDLNAASYEAFQPPLYYALAAPIFRLPLSIRHKVRALRLFSVLISAITIALVMGFIKLEFRDRSLPITALALNFFLVPGILMRNSTVSIASLELLVSTCFLMAAWWAARRCRILPFLLASLFLGLALLTKTTLVYLVFIYAVLIGAYLRRRAFQGTAVAVLAGIAILGAVLSPWVIFNENTYHSVTADALARQMQRPSQNSLDYHYGVKNLPVRLLMLGDVLPQEWEVPHIVQHDGTPVNATPPREAVAAILIALVLITVLLSALRSCLPRKYYWFVLPAILIVAELCYLLLIAQWDVFVVRYTYPALLPLTILVSAAAVELLPRQSLRVLAAAGLSVFLVAVFVAEARHGLGAKCCVAASGPSASSTPPRHIPLARHVGPLFSAAALEEPVA